MRYLWNCTAVLALCASIVPCFGEQLLAVHSSTLLTTGSPRARTRQPGEPVPAPPKKYSFKQELEDGSFETVESENRCVLRAKPGTRPPLSYLYDIATGEVLYLPTYRPENVVVTDRRKDLGSQAGKPTGEFAFKLVETADSAALLQRLKKEFPKVRSLDPTDGLVELTTKDWEKESEAGRVDAPTKTAVRKWNENANFHFSVDERDAAILRKIHANREPFPLHVTFKTPCNATKLTQSRVEFNASPVTHRQHYEHEDVFVYPNKAVDAAAKLLLELETAKDNEPEAEKKARQILAVFAKNATEKDRQMAKAFGYPNVDEAADDVVLRLKQSVRGFVFSINHNCQGYRSCLAELLYEARISNANEPERVPAKGGVIDILDGKRWAELLDAEDGDAPKAFAKLEKEKRIVYSKEQVDLFKTIQKTDEVPKFRRLKTRLWDPKEPEKMLVDKTDDYVIGAKK